MSQLGKIADSVDTYNRFVAAEVTRARTDAAFATELREKWTKLRASVGMTQSPTGTPLPRLALPDTDEPGAIAEYLFGQGFPGQFPYATAAYREMYLDQAAGTGEEPMRLFAGLGLAEDTNARFKYLSRHQKSLRLSTAFDGPTLYGLDSDHPGVLGKVGEGGVAIDTVEDLGRLFAGFDLTRKDASVSMTMNAPAPVILAMFIAAAKRRFGADCVPNLRGTIQADMLKEVQAQNEVIFPVDASLRFLCDMIEWCVPNMPRWYPVSISGYHIAEAGATPVQQAAFTLSNGFTYAGLLQARGVDINQFGPRLSFFLDCGLDVEYLVLGRVCRRIWAIGLRDVFGAGPKAQILKLHTQTSGRSLVAAEFQNNLTRTAVELMLAYMNYTNSCHSNSADEPFTTPTEKYALLASHGQSILLEESGLFKHHEPLRRRPRPPRARAAGGKGHPRVLPRDGHPRRCHHRDGAALPAQQDPGVRPPHRDPDLLRRTPHHRPQQVRLRRTHAERPPRPHIAEATAAPGRTPARLQKGTRAEVFRGLATPGQRHPPRRQRLRRTRADRRSLLPRPDHRLPHRRRWKIPADGVSGPSRVRL
jgi:methylmalonyl-CoA mutase cobalamin-binding domain/chain